MGSRSTKERARRALDAMKALGFSKKEATPVLRSLLNLFDHSWEPIEDECYRALADAILDTRDRPQPQEQELEHRSHSPTGVPPEDHPSTSLVVQHGGPRDLDSETDAPCIKRRRTNFTADHSVDPQPPPSTAEAQYDMPPISSLGASPELNHPQTRASIRSCQATADGVPSSVTARKRAIQMMDEDFQHAVFLRDPKPEPDMDAVQCNAAASSCQNAQVGIISHPLNTSSSGAADRLALPPPDQNPSGAKGRTIQRCRTRAASTSFIEPMNSIVKQPQGRENALDHIAVMHNTGTRSAVGNTQEAHCLHTVVASSTMGEVKMSIKCSIDPSKFHMPDLEAVYKMVEDKCLCSYKTLPPNFSIGSLITEICQCVAQLGNDQTREHNIQSDGFDNGRNSQNESTTSSAPFVEPIACMNSGSGKYKAVEESLVLEPSRNGTRTPNSTVAQQPHLALSHLRPSHDVSDISKGEEKVRISVVNEFGSEKCPASFYYIPRSLVFQKAYVNISVASIGDEDCCADCFGNCLSAPIPCACARETGGEFAYTPDGLVRTAFLDKCVSMNRFPEKHHKFFCKSCPLERSRSEDSPEPCRGHLIRKFIKECWSKCGCSMQCGNRVVQRGIACNLQVFFTREGKGWGLRTLDELPKGAFVCEYVGELLTNTELHERTAENMHNARYTYPVLLDAEWGAEGVLKDEEALCLDATFYGNVGRFINHRCYDANLIEIPVEVETPDHHYYHIAFFTTKKVEGFEELTWDYGTDFDDDKHPMRAFQCLCGSRYCRGRKHLRRRGKAAAK